MVTMEAELKDNFVLEALLLSERQKAYAISNSINATMKLIQERQRLKIQEDVTVRKSKFILRQIAIIKPFARPTVGRMWAMIRIGQKKRLRLSQFEEGGSQHPELGANIAIPIVGGARPSQRESVPPGMYLSRLNLHRQGSQLRGTSPMGPVFVIKNRGVFIREGGAIKTLYRFVASEDIQRRLHFYSVAIHTTNEVLPAMLHEQVVASMNHTMAKGASGLLQSAIAGTVAATLLGRFGIGSGTPEDESDGPDSE
jgi:hypothetical protein